MKEEKENLIEDDKLDAELESVAEELSKISSLVNESNTFTKNFDKRYDRVELQMEIIDRQKNEPDFTYEAYEKDPRYKDKNVHYFLKPPTKVKDVFDIESIQASLAQMNDSLEMKALSRDMKPYKLPLNISSLKTAINKVFTKIQKTERHHESAALKIMNLDFMSLYEILNTHLPETTFSPYTKMGHMRFVMSLVKYYSTYYKNQSIMVEQFIYNIKNLALETTEDITEDGLRYKFLDNLYKLYKKLGYTVEVRDK